MKLYHGSSICDLTELKPLSALHGSDETRVLYLTGSIPYALFYIWDQNHNKSSRKYITCGLKNGLITYEEHFPNQLKAFYQGVSGYLYVSEQDHNIETISNREDMYFSCGTVPVTEAIFIPDVYEAILHYEQADLVHVIRYNEMPQERLQLLHDHITQLIVAQNLPFRPETELAQFYATYFPALWVRAAAQINAL